MQQRVQGQQGSWAPTAPWRHTGGHLHSQTSQQQHQQHLQRQQQQHRQQRQQLQGSGSNLWPNASCTRALQALAQQALRHVQQQQRALKLQMPSTLLLLLCRLLMLQQTAARLLATLPELARLPLLQQMALVLQQSPKLPNAPGLPGRR
jgi:hypothetical protein